MSFQPRLTACSYIGPGSRGCNWTKVREAVFAGKDKVLYQSIEGGDCAPENATVLTKWKES